MSAMECLGRTFNVVPIAAGVGLKLASGVGYTFVTTGSDTFTVTFASTFGGSYATGGTLVCNVYKSAATNGTAAWVQDQTLISTNTVVSGGAIATAFYISDVFAPDGKAYVKCSAAGAGLVMAIQGDLTVKRTPPNLAILSA
jgi:hypothetical protein